MAPIQEETEEAGLEPVHDDGEDRAALQEADGCSDSTDLSSCPSMSRQCTEYSQAVCTDLMERQCSTFSTRQGDFWKRQSTTPASPLGRQLSMQQSHSFGRQASCPPAGGLSRIDDDFTPPESGRATPSVGSQMQLHSDKEDEEECGVIEQALCGAAISDCGFAVTLADPTGLDFELIAVSTCFEELTGYFRDDIVGENCRFLNSDCPMHPAQRAGLHNTCETGNPFLSVLVNRKKSGELFLNFLDLRGLVLARNQRTGEEIWILVGILQDVTGVERSKLPKNHFIQLRKVAGRIHKYMLKQLAEQGICGALARHGKGYLPDGMHILPDVQWRAEDEPNDSGVPLLMDQLPDVLTVTEVAQLLEASPTSPSPTAVAKDNVTTCVNVLQAPLTNHQFSIETDKATFRHWLPIRVDIVAGAAFGCGILLCLYFRRKSLL